MVVTVIATGYDLKTRDNSAADLTSEIFKDNYHQERPVNHQPSKPLNQDSQRVANINSSFENLNKPKQEKPVHDSTTSNLPDWLKVKYKK